MNLVPSMEQQFLEKLIKVVEDNFKNEQFQVTDLATEMGMSRATLHRKVKAITGKTITQFINEIRLNAAKQFLTNRSGTVSEVAYMVGFGSSTYFIKCFREHFGFSPGEVLKENFQMLETSQPIENTSQKNTPLYLKLGIPIVVLAFIFVFLNLFRNSRSEDELPPPATQNQAALNLYLQGLHLIDVYNGSQDAQYIVEAGDKFTKAIQLDSTFGDAYAHLAELYLSYIPYSEFTNKGDNYTDSARVFIEIADVVEMGDADFLLQMKALYYQSVQDYEKALNILEQRWEDNEKNYEYYLERGEHGYLMRDYNACIENLLVYLNQKPKSQIPEYDKLMKLTLIFSYAGFQKEAQEFAYRQFQLINDSAKYWNWYLRIIYESGNLEATINHYESAYERNELGTTTFNKLLEMYMLSGQNTKGLNLLPEYTAYMNSITGTMPPNYLVGYFLFLKNETGLANIHFKNEIRRWEYLAEVTGNQESFSNYVNIAACYAMLNDKVGAVESLQILANKNSIPFLAVLKLQKSPMFANLDSDEDFLFIKNEIVDKYYNEQQAIKKSIEKYPVEYSYKEGGISVVRK